MNIGKNVWKKALRVEQRIVARVTVGAHFAYYGLVGIEAHGSYRYAAVAVLLMMALEVASGDHSGGSGGA